MTMANMTGEITQELFNEFQEIFKEHQDKKDGNLGNKNVETLELKNEDIEDNQGAENDKEQNISKEENTNNTSNTNENFFQ